MKFKRAADRTGANRRISRALRSYVNQRISSSGELKHVYGYANTTVSTSVVYSQLSVIATGATDVARVGDSVKLKKLVIGFNTAVADTTNIMRVIIFQWNLPTNPTDAEVFEDTTNNVTYTCGSICRDSMHARKLRILYDRQVTFNGVSAPNMYWRKSFNLNRLRKCNYIGGSSTVGMGNIWIAYVSDSSAVSHPALQYAYTLDFTDL